MDKQDLRAALKDASDVVADLPQHLQEKAFEIAAEFFIGTAPADVKGSRTPHKAAQNPLHDTLAGDGSDGPDVSDLLKLIKRNADRYVVFMHDIEVKGEANTPDVLEKRFAAYRQDRPKNIHRDLGALASTDWAEKHGKGRSSPWILKRKGRERHAQLADLAKNSG